MSSSLGTSSYSSLTATTAQLLNRAPLPSISAPDGSFHSALIASRAESHSSVPVTAAVPLPRSPSVHRVDCFPHHPPPSGADTPVARPTSSPGAHHRILSTHPPQLSGRAGSDADERHPSLGLLHHRFASQSLPSLNSSSITAQLGFLPISAAQLTIEEKLLGEGGCGSVHLGRWVDNGSLRTVAIKRLRQHQTTHRPSRDPYTAQQLTISRGFHQHFLREMRVMQQVRLAPHIITIYGACVERGQECIVMEYMNRGNLYTFLHTPDGQRLAWPQRIRIAREIVQSIDYLHSRGDPTGYILHGDIKSLNILLDEQLSVRVSDFGLSMTQQSIKDNAAPNIMSSGGAGTPLWTAPELLPHGGEYTRECDMFSLGVVLWELATNERPTYPIRDAKELRWPEQWTVPGHFKRWVLDCCAARPSARPTAAALLTRIEDATAFVEPSSIDTTIVRAPLQAQVSAVGGGPSRSTTSNPHAVNSRYSLGTNNPQVISVRSISYYDHIVTTQHPTPETTQPPSRDERVIADEKEAFERALPAVPVDVAKLEHTAVPAAAAAAMIPDAAVKEAAAKEAAKRAQQRREAVTVDSLEAPRHFVSEVAPLIADGGFRCSELTYFPIPKRLLPRPVDSGPVYVRAPSVLMMGCNTLSRVLICAVLDLAGQLPRDQAWERTVLFAGIALCILLRMLLPSSEVLSAINYTFIGGQAFILMGSLMRSLQQRRKSFLARLHRQLQLIADAPAHACIFRHHCQRFSEAILGVNEQLLALPWLYKTPHPTEIRNALEIYLTCLDACFDLMDQCCAPRALSRLCSRTDVVDWPATFLVRQRQLSECCVAIGVALPLLLLPDSDDDYRRALLERDKVDYKATREAALKEVHQQEMQNALNTLIH